MDHLEGRQSVLAALQARQRRFRAVLIRQGTHASRVQDVLQAAATAGVAVRWAPREELDALAHGGSHGGVLAICGPKPRTSAEGLLDLLARRSEPPLLLLLEGVDDARNLGFTLRSAEAFGASAVLVKKHLWDFDPVEVARPASGAYERMPIVQIDSTSPLVELKKRGIRIIAAVANARRAHVEADLAGPSLLVVGGEKRGISGAVRALADQFVSIPTQPGSASLPLSHAAAVLLAEAARQRAPRTNSQSAM